METQAMKFYASSKFLKGFVLGRFCEFWTKMILDQSGIIFELVHGGEIKGALGAVSYPDVYSGDLIATEFFWWVDPQNRGRGIELYNRFEEWARTKQCKRIRMTHLCDLMPEGLKWLYGEMGFHAIEINYEKELAP